MPGLRMIDVRPADVTTGQTTKDKQKIIKDCQTRIETAEDQLRAELEKLGYNKSQINYIFYQTNQKQNRYTGNAIEFRMTHLVKLRNTPDMPKKVINLINHIFNNLDTIEREQKSIRVFKNSHQKMENALQEYRQKREFLRHTGKQPQQH